MTSCEGKGRAPSVRRVPGTLCNGVMHGVEGHMGARTAPLTPLEWIEYGPPWGPMTRGALPPCVSPLARGSLGSCMGLEVTWGPVLHPSPPWNGLNMAPLGGQ